MTETAPPGRLVILAGAPGVGATSLDVEIVCSDVDAHRRRVETRASDIDGLTAPDWAAVSARDRSMDDVAAYVGQRDA